MKFLERIFLGKHCQVSFSQCGEDVIVNSVFNALSIPRPAYLDIGAHDPCYLSNTYFFYRRGCRGVCIEANPELHARIRTKRRRDTCLNAGISGTRTGAAPFFVMSEAALSTFSREEAERLQRTGRMKIRKVIQVPLLPVNDCIERHFPSPPNLVSLDVEGIDVEVIASFDFSRFRPQVFVIETLTYTVDKTEEKTADIPDLMRSNGYMVYADTFVNTIFVDEGAWKNRPS